MKRNYLPPLLRGIGTTLVLAATAFSVMVARGDLQKEHNQRNALRAQTEAEAKVQPATTQNLAELMVEFEELQSEVKDDDVIDEVIDNPWFNYAGFLGTAIIASSFFVEAFQRRRSGRELI